jgi:hypothetical protein
LAWSGEGRQNTTCSYLTGTFKPEYRTGYPGSEGTRTILRQQVVGPSNDEFADQPAELFQLRVALLLLFICSICVSTPENLRLEVALEVELRTQILGVGKVEEGKVLRQVVLDRSSGEDDSALDIESGESLEGESVCHPSEQAV